MRLPSMTLEIGGRNVITVGSDAVYVGPFTVGRTATQEQREVHAFELGKRAERADWAQVDRWLDAGGGTS